jgi:hypothetical protein
MSSTLELEAYSALEFSEGNFSYPLQSNVLWYNNIIKKEVNKWIKIKRRRDTSLGLDQIS